MIRPKTVNAENIRTAKGKRKEALSSCGLGRATGVIAGVSGSNSVQNNPFHFRVRSQPGHSGMRFLDRVDDLRL
jgi:hypothetical protein